MQDRSCLVYNFIHSKGKGKGKGKGNGKGHPRTGHEGPEMEYMYNLTLYLTSAVDGGGWSAPRLNRFTPGINHCIVGWVDPRVGLEGCGRFASTVIRSPDRLARRESLYRLSYPGPLRDYFPP